ncbi:hypothetical protein F3Y22_tig00017575pilonHSYRG00006 [Hibiscus syriacus]|uniref:CDT1 Geminin-binding domain-containing protein n=1 Tax=Hibiscus syriacus TaxID=106335 RepID=A0A6A3C1B2_HIBSY|nr:hypothetical protein F3Y22_tig00017575pilonHSYRG00006 [Hibiscus syriacus]
MSSSDSLKATPLKSKTSRSLTSKSPEVRQVAQTRSKASTVQIKSARKQILSWPTESPPPKASGGRPDKLPEKYEILCEFYNSLDSAIRLLRSKGPMLLLQISAPKECLTDRRVLYSHLAQLKHILPEAIEIKRILLFDEMSSCMKPDLHVSIILDAIDFGDNSKSENKNLKLRKVFRDRLVDYSKAHPEVFFQLSSNL